MAFGAVLGEIDPFNARGDRYWGEPGPGTHSGPISGPFFFINGSFWSPTLGEYGVQRAKPYDAWLASNLAYMHQYAGYSISAISWRTRTYYTPIESFFQYESNGV